MLAGSIDSALLDSCPRQQKLRERREKGSLSSTSSLRVVSFRCLVALPSLSVAVPKLHLEHNQNRQLIMCLSVSLMHDQFRDLASALSVFYQNFGSRTFHVSIRSSNQLSQKYRGSVCYLRCAHRCFQNIHRYKIMHELIRIFNVSLKYHLFLYLRRCQTFFALQLY